MHVNRYMVVQFLIKINLKNRIKSWSNQRYLIRKTVSKDRRWRLGQPAIASGLCDQKMEFVQHSFLEVLINANTATRMQFDVFFTVLSIF